MKKGILSLAVVALLGFFMNSCTPEVLFEGMDKVVVDLGSTDADVLAFVTVSSGKDITVTGIDYDKAGPQTATFTAKDETEDAVIKIKTDKLSGSYEYSVVGNQGISSATITQSATVYNNILIGGFLENASLEATCVGNILTFKSTNLTAGEFTGVLNGTGVFEKVGTTYQVKDVTLTSVWSDGETEVLALTFTKK